MACSHLAAANPVMVPSSPMLTGTMSSPTPTWVTPISTEPNLVTTPTLTNPQTLPTLEEAARTDEPFNPLGLIGCKLAPKQLGAFAPTRSPEICGYDFSFPFRRPIDPPGRSVIETSYRFGSTQNGKRAPHHGVDMINKAGVPVLAVADGKVIVAGDDLSVKYAPHTDFYGNLVILEHNLPSFEQPVFTLYGHLLKVTVKAGQKVRSGQQIGEVGVGGVAAGTHLHFEVRMGKNSYEATRNPELWLMPLLDDDGRPTGVLAGRFVDQKGDYIENGDITLQHVDATGKPIAAKLYLSTYEEHTMLGQPPWKESFAVGSLSTGLYRLVFIHSRPIEFTAEVMPGKITFLTFILE